MGPKRQPGTAANPVAGQAAGPLEKPNASQNCPQLYQGESGGLEPAMKPMAGQAGAHPAPPFASEGARGPPRSIFGHFLLIKKVATQASDVCLTNSQTTALPMAQSKNPGAASNPKVFQRRDDAEISIPAPPANPRPSIRAAM